MNENPEPIADDSITIIEQLLTDLLQLVHGTLKKLVQPEPIEDDHGEDGEGGMTDLDARTAELKKKAPGSLIKKCWIVILFCLKP